MSWPSFINRRLRAITPAFAAVAVVCAAYFAGLGHNPLLDPDEPIYGQFVKEMVRSGDWLTPHYNGGLWFDKPPLFYWLACLCVKLVGFGEYAIRMPSAIFAALTVLMVYALAAYDFGKRAGAIAAVVMGTTILQIIMSRAAATDTIMVFFMTASLYAYRRWLDSEGRARLGWMAACGSAAGLGMVAKTPAVPLLLLVTFVIHLTWTRQLRKLRFADALVGVAAALVLGLPWYVAMYAMHGWTFVDQLIITTHFTRFTSALHKSQTGQWWSYLRNIPMLMLFFFPWSVFLPQAIVRHWRSNPAAKLAFCWFAAVMVFFSLSKTQNFTYTLPAFPACAMFVGMMFSEAGMKDALDKRARAGLWIGLAFAGLMAAALIVMAGDKFPPAMSAAVATAVVLVLTFAVPVVWMLARRSRPAAIPWMVTAGMVVFSMAVVYGIAPVLSDYKSSKKLAHYISRSSGVKVVAYDLWRPGLFYYLGRKPMDIKTSDEVKRLARSDKPVFFVCKERDEMDVQRYCPNRVYNGGDVDIYANKAYLREAGRR